MTRTSDATRARRTAKAMSGQRRRAVTRQCDELTGLWGRSAMQRRLAAPVAAGLQRAVVLLDVDAFGLVNQTYGPDAGDDVLRVLGERLRTLAGRHVLSRWQADEFVCLVESVDAVDEAGRLAGLMARCVRDPFHVAGDRLYLTLSAGLADSVTVTQPEMIRAAGAALRSAKLGGRDRAVRYSSDSPMDVAGDLRVVHDLRNGIEHGELRLKYQPMIELETNNVVGVEALVRWERPGVGLLGPAYFIDLAERTGQIVPLGAWIAREACRTAVELSESGQGQCTVSINLSARQLSDPGLVAMLRSAQRDSGAARGAITIEVTETALMHDMSAATITLTHIKGLGMGLDLDDFGTGYSSLLYLKHFPVDRIKIDQSFVGGLGLDAADTAIVASTISLAHSVGVRTVAEGVETPEQLAMLRQMGCDYVQGYLVSPPLDLTELQRWFGEQQHHWKSTPTPAQDRDDAAGQRDEAGGQRDQLGGQRDLAGNRRDQAGDERDQAGGRRDQAGDERDQAGEERDQAGDDRDQAGEARDRVAGRRDEADEARDRAAQARDDEATRRDRSAQRRDRAAEKRDQSALARDVATARGETLPAMLAREGAAADRAGASRDRRAAATQRARALRDRVEARADRGSGARARSQAGGDRTPSLADRGFGASERSYAEVDRTSALADRGAGANERSHAELDRTTSLADRGAGAEERTHAGQDRTTSQADRGASARERNTASKDGLTGAYNRAAGFVELTREIARSVRTQQSLVVAFIDVDHLKALNDARGHAAGDRLLREVANGLRAQLRAHDLVIRYGGDEFVCALSGLTLADAGSRMKRVNDALSLGGEGGSITAGLAALRPGESPQSLVARADADLYERRDVARHVRADLTPAAAVDPVCAITPEAVAPQV